MISRMRRRSADRGPPVASAGESADRAAEDPEGTGDRFDLQDLSDTGSAADRSSSAAN
ncbi:hypothetical protein [Micromonospora gifhornensis]|uniref:hypothetical protein n=1 Tax=Micromonospora gifhornensis TaxID=84594 RepID=UPI003665DDE7